MREYTFSKFTVLEFAGGKERRPIKEKLGVVLSLAEGGLRNDN
jgi:hypothetical protein